MSENVESTETEKVDVQVEEQGGDTQVNENATVQTEESKSSKSKKGGRGKSVQIKTLNQARKEIKKDGKPVAVQSQELIPISSIVKYDNPRNEPEYLYDAGYELIGDPKVDKFDPEKDERVSLVHLALSDDIEDVKHFVELIEEYEHVDRKKSPHGSQTIYELARDIAEFEQIYPILVKKEKNNKYRGIDGGRRIAAILYLHAKSRVLQHEGKEDPKIFGKGVPDEYPAAVLATSQNVSEDDLFLRSVVANLSRKDFSPLQQGKVFRDMLKKTNPNTGKPFTIKEASDFLRVPYGTFRNHAALWKPYDPNTGKGLTDSEREKVQNGEMLVTAAARKSLGEKHYSKNTGGRPVGSRRRSLPLKEMERLFDESAESNSERRKAIAQCMGLDFEEAVKESEKRIEEMDLKDMEQNS